jgi:hypothetical protein
MRLERGGFHDTLWPMVMLWGQIKPPWSSARCRLVPDLNSSQLEPHQDKKYPWILIRRDFELIFFTNAISLQNAILSFNLGHTLTSCL